MNALRSSALHFLFAALFCFSGSLLAETTDSTEPTEPEKNSTKLPKIVISSRHDDGLGISDSQSQGTVGAKELDARPFARPGEVLETVPGMIITQHSGGGKANQYYLRGFQLDHGTDFGFYVDGVPINLPSHAHGQGYADLNWLIPELVQGVTYEKGVYHADQGEFSSVGTANIKYFDVLPENLAIAQVGTLGYGRGLFAATSKVGDGNLLYAFEILHNDGGWVVPNDYRKYNGIIKYSQGNEKAGLSLALQAYDGIWLGNDQIPQRAINSGFNRFGSFDASTGGQTDRFSLYSEWHRQDEESSTSVLAYLVRYDLDLFSNFTYFLNDPVNGDEIEQHDASRYYTGVRAQHTFFGKLFDRDMENTFGFQVRQDWADVTLNNTKGRYLVSHVRTDNIAVLDLSPWVQNKIRWTDWFRTTAGLRADGYSFNNASDAAGDSGHQIDGLLSPKLSLIFGPWDKTEYYLSGGLGFRTNDVRGVFSVNGGDLGGFNRPLPDFVRRRGAEVGIRSSAVPDLNSTLAFWVLSSDSDTFFDGDTGATTDADRPGIRYGVEWTNFYTPADWLTIDFDFSDSWARFTDNDPQGVGMYIPESVTTVISAGVTASHIPGIEAFSASVRLRQFGPRPLIEDNSQQSAPSAVFNFQAGYELSKTWMARIEILNLFNANYNDAEYYYTSRLQGEPSAGIADHMVHAGEPRSVRVEVAARF